MCANCCRTMKSCMPMKGHSTIRKCKTGWIGSSDDGFGLWGVVEKGSNELIGQCGITYQEFDGKRVPEIGYLFRKEFWHKGFAIEAAVACREYAFHTLGFEEVYSIIRDTNIASQKVARRNSMQKVATFIKHYRGVDMPHFVYKVSLCK